MVLALSRAVGGRACLALLRDRFSATAHESSENVSPLRRLLSDMAHAAFIHQGLLPQQRRRDWFDLQHQFHGQPGAICDPDELAVLQDPSEYPRRRCISHHSRMLQRVVSHAPGQQGHSDRAAACVVYRGSHDRPGLLLAARILRRWND